MKSLTVTAALLVLASAPAFADQLSASAGLDPAEAAGMSLTEIAQAKFNRDTRGDDRQAFVVPGQGGDHTRLAVAAGLPTDAAETMTLAQIFVAKVNREARGDDRQADAVARATMSSRSPRVGAAYGQLAASAGLSPADVAGLSLAEIAAVKFARDTAGGDN